jgi:hypothetical protein
LGLRLARELKIFVALKPLIKSQLFVYYLSEFPFFLLIFGLIYYGEKFVFRDGVDARVDSFKLSTADFESINLTEDSQVYLSLTKRVSHNN